MIIRRDAPSLYRRPTVNVIHRVLFLLGLGLNQAKLKE